MLDEAASVGLRLVYAGKLGALAGTRRQLCLDVTGGEPGGLRITPVMRGDGEPAAPVRFIGTEGHGLVYVDRAQAAAGEHRELAFPAGQARQGRSAAAAADGADDERLEVPAAREPRFRDGTTRGCGRPRT